MMKILLLNPHLYDAPVVTTLQKLGVAVLVCSDFKECELVHRFHTTSVSLFVGHDEDGLKMNDFLKSNSKFANTPVILTTSKWSEKQCIDHQSSPKGANAYLRLPVDDKDFIHVIDEVLGTQLSHGHGYNISDDLSAIAPIATEDATSLSIFTPDNTQSEIPSNFIPEDKGVTLLDIGEKTRVAGIQIEDAASVYSTPTPGIESPSSDLLSEVGITLDEPTFGLGESTSGTMELRPGISLEEPSTLAKPIAAISDELPPFIEEAATRVAPVAMTLTPDEQPTRVAVMPILNQSIEKDEIDDEALSSMPYLGKATDKVSSTYSNPLGYREPMDDAVVPGGAAHAPDVDTLKKYLYLREQDVTALSAQLRQAREQIGSLETQLKHEKAVTTEFAHLAQEQDRRISTFDKEKLVALESSQKEIDELKFEMKRRSEKIRVMELQVIEATEATEKLKDRVRSDIRKIRTREKELENRLEIMKKDSESLLDSREQKIIELKRKLDITEFNTDLLQDQLEKERKTCSLLREKLAKAAQIVRVAGGLLSPEEEALLSNREMPEANRTSAA